MELAGDAWMSWNYNFALKMVKKLDNGKPWVEVEVSASGTDPDEVENFVSRILEISTQR